MIDLMSEHDQLRLLDSISWKDTQEAIPRLCAPHCYFSLATVCGMWHVCGKLT